MDDSSDATSRLVALALGVLGLLVIAAPFAVGAHALWIALGFTVGGVLLMGALAAVSPSLSGEIVPIRGGR